MRNICAARSGNFWSCSRLRGLFVRLDEFDRDGARQVRDRLRSTLETIAARIERIAADPAGWSDAPRLRREISAAQAALRSTATEIEGLAGAAPFDQLADALLIVGRVRDLLRGLAMVVVIREASRRNSGAPQGGRREQRDFQGRQEAWLLAVRAAVAMLLLSGIWMATGWNEGFTAVSGGAIMLFFGVNQDNPQAGARSYLVWSSIGMLVAYLAIVFLLPFLQGFEALAIVLLLLLLLPAGLMAGTPSYAWAGIALGGWTVAEAGFGNVFRPDELAYFNNAFALIVGMLVCLAVIAVMPVTSYARRGQSWQHAVGAILPGVARGVVNPRRGASEIVSMLAALLPRLALDRQREQDFLSGTLSAASSTIELGRLRDLKSDPAMPANAGHAIAHFLDRFADALEALAGSHDDRQARLAEAEAIVAELHAELASQTFESRPASRAVLRAAASLRFIADRFLIDRAYLERRFAED